MKTQVRIRSQQGVLQDVTEQEIEEIEEIIFHENNPPREEIYVAVGKDSAESISALKWALQNLDNRQETLIILLHVRLPLRYMPSPIGKIPLNQVSEDVVKAHLKVKEKELETFMKKYLDICKGAQVKAELLFVEKNDVAKGIVEVISEKGVKKLVMGTSSAGGAVSRRMMMPRRGKADYVRKQAVESCDVAIVCKDKLVLRTQGSPVDDAVAKKSKSFDWLLSDLLCKRSEASTIHLPQENYNRSVSLPPNLGQDLHICNQTPSEEGNDSERTFTIDEDSFDSESEDSSETLFDQVYSQGTVEHESLGHQDDNTDIETLKEQLIKALRMAENAEAVSRKDTAKRKKPEIAAVKENCRIKELESGFKETVKENEKVTSLLRLAEEKCQEFSRRQSEVEENSESMADKINKISCERNEAIHELQATQRKLAATVEQNQRILQEKDAQIRLLQDRLHSRPLLETLSPFSSFNNLEFSEYTFDDVKAATSNLSEHLKLGEGGYGIVYKGKIGQTTVAAKILRENSLQGQQEFEREIDILREVRHPHLVRVVGACFERGCIIYEYMSNGCLADHLSSRKARRPLPWQARIRIAAEMCSALQYLHSFKPDPIVHRDLKPGNILLDENYTSKISDFGLARPLPQDLRTESEPKGTFCYMDPEYLTSGKYSTKSDVYTLGIIILQLLTGKPPLRVVQEVENALECAKLEQILDPSAGDWPFAEATQLAYIALHCTCPVREERPDLQPTVMKMLDQLRNNAIPATNGGGLAKRGQKAVQAAKEIHFPGFFHCPILKARMVFDLLADEIMLVFDTFN
ncbi:U-box domain-containing protein 33 isoform X1 [Cryptomeria japonica]|uniref:U-box domain-containing protein 33 isoform X1 n=1 Tax=Cryptomeria japonica TaxID=3369 RepID=UPI0027DA613F|nr:U-box domain-containing protein 33 isoform X1 [Cryptomeria japonica]